MSSYIEAPVTVDPDSLATIAFDTIQGVFPGWEPNAGNLETILVESVARIAAVDATLAASVLTSIFRFFGPLVGVNPINATPASTTATVTMVDTAGYTIPAGTIVDIPAAGDTTVQFAVVTAVTVPNGSSSTATGAVTLVALQPGASGSGLGSPGLTVNLNTTLTFVSTVTLTAATTNGLDAETDASFLSRLATEMRLLTPRPILPGDFAAIALNTAGVARALAIDMYQPAVNEVQSLSVNATGGTFTVSFGAHTTTTIAYNATAATVQAALVALTSIGAGGVSCVGGPLPSNPVTVTFVGPNAGVNEALMTTTSTSLTGGTHTATVSAVTDGAAAVTTQERCCTVAVVDSNGNAVDSTIKTALLTYLQAAREATFLPYVIDPTFNEIDVTFEVACYTGYDPDTVVTNATAAAAAFLSPANWGNPGTAGGGASWLDTPTVRYTDLATVIRNTPGVSGIVTLGLCAHGGSPSTSNVTLTGPAALTTAGTITGTHT